MRYSRFRTGPDLIITATVMTLLAFSLLVLYSATYKSQSLGFADQYWVRQGIWMLVGIVAMFVLARSDYRRLGMISWSFYGIGVGLLVLVLAIGRTISGSQRWLHIGGLTIQPSEFMKVIFIVTLAWYFDSVKHEKVGLKHIFVSALITAVPFILIVKEPDLGTALVFVPIYTMMLFVAGASLRYFLLFGCVGLLSSPLVWFFFLKGYQKQRIMMFLNPHDDQFGAGWTIIQSKIAIGSGRFWGKGVMKGSQTQLDFLPEHHTDFIFSVIGEEWGFVGSFAVLGLFFLLITRSLMIAHESYDVFGRLTVVGVVTMMTFQIIVNIGMTFGSFPVTGLPLPLFSYGGSALVSVLIGLGLILSVKHVQGRL